MTDDRNKTPAMLNSGTRMKSNSVADKRSVKEIERKRVPDMIEFVVVGYGGGHRRI